MTPKLTVVISAYNRREFVEEAILSVLGQTLPRSQYQIVLIKNFGSESVDSLADKNQIVNVQSRDVGLGDKYIEALEVSDGDVLCFLDDDDLFDRRKLEAVSRAFSEYPELGYFHNRYVPFRNDHVPLVPAKVAKHSSKAELLSSTSLEPRDMYNLIQLNVNCSSISMKREIVASYSDLLRPCKAAVDVLLLYAAILSRKPMMVCPDVLTYYRIHPTNMSLTSPSLSFATFVKGRFEHSKNSYDEYSRVLRHCVGAPIEKMVRFQLAWNNMSMNIFSDQIRDRLKIVTSLVDLLKGWKGNYPMAKVVQISLAGIASIALPGSVRHYSYRQRNRVILDADVYELA